MIPLQFIAHIAGAREICQLDYNREVVPRAQQTMFCVEMTINIVSIDKTVDVEFLAHTEVPLMRIAALADSDRRNAVSFLMAKEGIPRLAKSGYLEIYRGVRVTLTGDAPIPVAEEPYKLSSQEEVNEHLATQLRDATTRQRAAAVKFEEAKEYLERNLHSIDDPSRLRGHTRFLASCMRRSGSPFMAAWNEEKSAVLIDHVEDLIRRRNPNHRGYVSAVEWIKSILYDIQPEKLWHDTPL